MSNATELTWRDFDHGVDLFVLHLLETDVTSFSAIFSACAKSDACQTWQGPEVFRESLVAWGFKIDSSDTVSV